MGKGIVRMCVELLSVQASERRASQTRSARSKRTRSFEPDLGLLRCRTESSKSRSEGSQEVAQPA